MDKVNAKTKSGATVQVLEILESEIVDQTIEGRLYEAARLAAEQKCHSWKIRSSAGTVIAYGRAGQALHTREQAAAMSGPPGDQSGW